MNVRRVSALAVLVVAGSALSFAVAGSASASASGGRIGPKQMFVGLVNGSTGAQAPAQIKVACPGPVHDGEMTHPLKHQTLAVTPPASAAQTVGNTGPHGHEISAFLGIPPSAVSGGGLATFRTYGHTKPIPTSLSVPCSGSSHITFIPFPRVPGESVPFVVPVEFVNIAV